ncbi:hypothetical protein MJO28_011268 [Puccinia striiformis f. sp. tritici]|uniref:Uncharacterized protein n=1 Tax=Puccinia striiformis f. sp. tritici TaxID=168172 RepID=A0ACC0E1N8_9BASI|nr:hypothetical protein MJO28_011268 [Puccinia striiformis f. sp. tritici]
MKILCSHADNHPPCTTCFRGKPLLSSQALFPSLLELSSSFGFLLPSWLASVIGSNPDLSETRYIGDSNYTSSPFYRRLIRFPIEWFFSFDQEHQHSLASLILGFPLKSRLWIMWSSSHLDIHHSQLST